jgi:hypothetical protein
MGSAKAAKDGPVLRLQVLRYPNLDATTSKPSWKALATGAYLVSHAEMIERLDAYLPQGVNRKDSKVSPLFATDLADVAPALIVTGGSRSPPKSGLNQLFSRQRTAQLLPLWRLRSNLAREVCIVADPYRTPIFAFTLLCDETLRPPVGQRSPQPLKGTKGKESQPNQAGNNVDGPHTSHDINILVVLEFAVKLPWSPLEEELAA